MARKKRVFFTDAQAKRIVNWYKKGWKVSEIAERFGVSHSRVAYWVNKEKVVTRGRKQAKKGRTKPTTKKVASKGRSSNNAVQTHTLKSLRTILKAASSLLHRLEGASH